MAQTLPIEFPLPSESAIASYSWTDIAEGTGIVRFYLAEAEDSSSTTTEFLTTNSSFYSNDTKITEAVAQGATYAKEIDVDYDVVFNTPRRIKGKAYANLYIYGYSNIANNIGYYVIWKIRHYDGATETDVATVQSSNKSIAAVPATEERELISLEADISSIQNYKIGDILRCTFEVWAYIAVGNGIGTIGIYHDPVDRLAAVDSLPTNSFVLIPFKLDL